MKTEKLVEMISERLKNGELCIGFDRGVFTAWVIDGHGDTVLTFSSKKLKPALGMILSALPEEEPKEPSIVYSGKELIEVMNRAMMDGARHKL